MKNILIVGAGFSGIVLANLLAKDNHTITLIEKREHIGGNCYDFIDENKILVHKYGPHIFHTNYDDVWEYLHQFTTFTDYQHQVVGWIKGKYIPIPFNLNSLEKSFNNEVGISIKISLEKYFSGKNKISITELRKKAKEVGDKNLTLISDYIFENVFKNYTIKQWGIKAEEISTEILNRVPIVLSKDDRYFDDKYQGMPIHGYTAMMEKMLESGNINIQLNSNFDDYREHVGEYDEVIFTGPIDDFFDYSHGKLEYKKTAYKMEQHSMVSFQTAATINYPNDYEYTRITEFKKFYPESATVNKKKTIICKEIPGIGDIDAYPVLNEENNIILQKYIQESEKNNNIHFIGRLANYKYFNMDQTIKNALDYYKNNFKGK